MTSSVDETDTVAAADVVDAELQALRLLRDAALELLALEADPELDAAAVEPARTLTRERYERYVAAHGPLNRGVLHEGPVDAQTGEPARSWRRPPLGGFRADPHYFTVMALEQYDMGTGTAAPAPVLLRRVNGRPQAVARVATPHEALLVSLGETGGGVDLERVAGLLGVRGARAAAHALGDLVYRDPDRGGTWITAREYLTGDLRARRVAAVGAARHDTHYRRNIEALDAAIPPELGPLEISVSLGAPWISASDIEEFVHDLTGGRVKVWHLPSAAHWKIVPLGKVPASEYAAARMTAYDLVTAGLNGRVPIVWATGYVNGRRVRERQEAASIDAQERLAAIQERFRVWVWEDAVRTRRLCAEYNRRFNAHRVTPYDGSQLTFPGLADGLQLWPWQRDAVMRVLSSPASMCGHAVGAGKTLSMVCSAVTARRLGLAGKPMIAVPAHLVEQVAREARQGYPFGRFLVAGDEPRELLAARVAAGDWDAVIVSHGRLASLPVDPGTERAWLDRQRSEFQRQVDAGFGGKFGRTELRRRIGLLDRRAERLAETPPPTLTFEGLGVDLLLVDEAHYFKRLPIVSRRAGVSFGSSQRAADLMLKAQVLRERRGRLPSLALFTGTPWSNSITETFVWQSFLQPDALAEAGIDSFDAWAAVFVDYETTVEVTPDGAGIRTASRPSRIRNVPELRTLFARCADVLPGSALPLERPRRVERTVVSRPGPQQLDYVHSLSVRADKIHRESVRALRGGDNMLVLCSDGRRAALDPWLVGVAEDSPKIAAIAEEVARIHHTNAATVVPGSDVPGVLQVIFCDQGTPGDLGLQTYGRLRIALHEHGVPAERVRFVHEARTDAARARLFAQSRDGEVAVLIGSTDTLGVGTNVQTRLRAVHHADAPWRPSDIEQREGRALRPGNTSPLVDVVRYVTEGTFDAYMWQTLQRKARFVGQLQRGTSIGVGVDGADARTIEDLGDVSLSYGEVKALATGNPLLLEHAQAAAELGRLKVLCAIDTQALTSARHDLDDAEQRRGAAMRLETMLRAARDRLVWFDGRVSDGDASPDDAVRAAGSALAERLRTPDPEAGPEPLRAPWRGLGVELLPEGGWAATRPGSVELRITLAHRRVHQVVLPAARFRRGSAAGGAAAARAATAWVTGLDAQIEQVAQEVTDAGSVADTAQRVIGGHRAARADELAAAQARLDEIEGALEASVVERF